MNLQGVREPQVYGTMTFDVLLEGLRKRYKDCEIGYFQSNVEGELIDKLHEVGFTYDGVILNAGGYSHTSVALHDAVAAIGAPVVEVHISNLWAREDYRHHSLVSGACKGVISGFGLDGYRLAIEALIVK